MKQLVFIEPYGSEGGHTYRNVTRIPRLLRKYGVSFAMIGERGFKCSDKSNCLGWLTHCQHMQNMPRVAAVAIRVDEFLNINEHFREAQLFFLSNYEIDIAAWIAILSRKQTAQQILSRGNQLIVHANSLYATMLGLNAIAENVSLNFRKRFLFTFFSEIQTHIARQDIPRWRFDTFFHPVYEEFFLPQRKVEKEPGFLSFLGGFQFRKRPDIIPAILQCFPADRFQIQFHPVTEINVKLFMAITRYLNRKSSLLLRLLSPPEYRRCILNTNVGLLPYDPYEYASQASGILEEFMLAGIPVVVPGATYLSFFLKRYGGAGVELDIVNAECLAKAIHKIQAHYPILHKQAISAAQRLGKERSTEEFLRRTAILSQAGQATTHSGTEEEAGIRSFLAKGRAVFYTAAAEMFLKQGANVRAADYCRRALAQNENYWKARYLHWRLFASDRKKAWLYLKEQMESNRSFNPYDVLCWYRQLGAAADARQSKAECTGFFRKYRMNDLLPLGENAGAFSRRASGDGKMNYISRLLQFAAANPALYHVALFFREENDLPLTKKFLRRFLCHFMAKKKAAGEICNWRTLALVYLGDSERAQQKNGWRNHYRRALPYMLHRKDKDELAKYRIASLYKNLGSARLAHKWFASITRSAVNSHLRAGALFHSAELDYQHGQLRSSFEALKKCLAIIPQHRKARELLIKLRKMQNG